jgi:signal transduction histidine kinase
MVNMVLREMPIPLESWRWVTDRATGFVGPFFIVYAQSLAGIRRPRVERAAFAWALTAAVVTLFLPWRLYEITVMPLHGVTLMMCGYAIWMLFRALQDSRAMRAAAVSISLVTLGFGFHDALIMMGLVGSDHLRLLAFAIPVSTLVLTAVLTERFLATFRRATNRNIELEERVQQKHLELEANFERTRELEEIRVVASERERIMREMHDGVGGHLVSILAMVEKGRARKSEIAASLRLSIDDMRMVIQSLDPNVDNLNVLLGVFRTRNEQRLRDHGLSARWEIEDLPSVDRLGRTEYLHILRILQEAVTNVARHAKAETIRVRAGMRTDDQGRAGVFIEVMDDGIGMGVESAAGRGRVNMARRARMIGAELQVDSSSEGTRLELWIPVEPDSRV